MQRRLTMPKTAFALLATLLISPPIVSDANEPKAAPALRPDADAFPRGDPAKLGISADALEKLRNRAEESKSDAVVIIKDGQLVADWDFDQKRGPIEAMSATKSIVSLAIGRLIDAGKIKSIEQPVCDLYPEWKQGRKKSITIHHLLSQTSGLQNVLSTVPEINQSPDFVQLALAAELSDDPGAKFSYNNKATNLLAGVVKQASGMRMDQFLGKELFEPLGIKDFGWTLDRAGNPHGMSGLQIRAIDLAKIGQMMLDLGSWKGQQILSKEWVKKSVEPSQELYPSYGLLWWLHFDSQTVWLTDDYIKYFKNQGMTPTSLAKLEELKGKPLEVESFRKTVPLIIRGDEVIKKKIDDLNEVPPLKRIVKGPLKSYEAQGYLGQFLVVVPRDRIVAVRQRRGPGGSDSELETKRSFVDFPDMVAALTQNKG
jgi:CubicO group peptidase (beta-lactamase class C family)